jgi:hypothetical protein
MEGDSAGKRRTYPDENGNVNQIDSIRSKLDFRTVAEWIGCSES